jgi:serine/threonine protein kinase
MTDSKDDASDRDDSTSLGDILREVARSPARWPVPEPVPGEHWGTDGRYVIERRVGAGAMGTVYQATDELLAKVVALKVLNRPFDLDEEDSRTLLLTEARIAARVEHEHVARIYDVGEHEGTFFLVLEFVEGTTLRSWMKGCRVITPMGQTFYVGARHVQQIVIEMAQGLSVLHEHGVIHRDLKPENVMVGNGLSIKLLDFGLARRMIDRNVCEEVASEVARPKRLPAWSGTLGYIAPERFEGAALRPCSDVFSLGVIIYELLTGSQPFGGDRPLTFLEATRTLPDLSVGAWPRFPKLKGVTARMLARDPEGRFADGTEALRALRYELGPREITTSWADARTRLQGMVLWVDDEPEKNAAEITTLGSVGLYVMTLRATEDALVFLSRVAAEPVLVISDIARAEGPREGYVLLDAMRRRSDSTPFFIYSSSAVEEDKRETLERGGQGCTSDDQELYQMVIAELRRRQ